MEEEVSHGKVFSQKDRHDRSKERKDHDNKDWCYMEGHVIDTVSNNPHTFIHGRERVWIGREQIARHARDLNLPDRAVELSDMYELERVFRIRFFRFGTRKGNQIKCGVMWGNEMWGSDGVIWSTVKSLLNERIARAWLRAGVYSRYIQERTQSDVHP